MSDPYDPNSQPRYPVPPVQPVAPLGPMRQPSRGSRSTASYVLVIVLVALFVISAAGFAVMALSAKPSPPPGSPGTQATADTAATPAHPGSGEPVTSHGPGDGTTQEPTPSTSTESQSPTESGPPVSSSTPTPTTGPLADMQMPMVPVVDFWSTQESISTHDLKAALQGQVGDYKGVIVPDGDSDAIGQALGISVDASVQTGSPTDILAKIRSGWLGIVRGSDLGPQMRALAIDGNDLVGENHVQKLGAWPFTATVSAPENEAWDQAATWTIAAGGDMFMDRGVENYTIKNFAKGINYPFQGGTAVVTGHCACSPSAQIPNELVPTVRRTGHAGAVRSLVQDADLAIANLENPVPDNPTWHLSGTIFGGPPKLLDMFNYAGIDWVSLANNHMYDYGPSGIDQTRANLKQAGIPFGGAGANVEEAGQISYLHANGRKIGIVACQEIVSAINAGPNNAGTLSCKSKTTVPLVQEARQNADVVIVFAHWGHEFFRVPFDSQAPLAQKWIDAGADIVMGSHPHVYGGLQEIDGKPVIYSMGNFIFDQYWSTDTMEGALTEITMQGNRVVQLRLHPYVILDQSQPNLLNPATDDGKQLLKEIRQVSDPMGW